jgi:hypothetical protein
MVGCKGLTGIQQTVVLCKGRTEIQQTVVLCKGRTEIQQPDGLWQGDDSNVEQVKVCDMEFCIKHAVLLCLGDTSKFCAIGFWSYTVQTFTVTQTSDFARPNDYILKLL